MNTADNPEQFMLIHDSFTPLKSNYKTLKFKWNDGPILIKFGDDNDLLSIDPKRDKLSDESAGFDWSVEVSIQNGKVKELVNSKIPLAPLGEYENIVLFQIVGNSPNWISMLNRKQVAFKTKSGKYGKVILDIYADREDFRVGGSTNIYFNTTGSRYLE